MQLQASSSIKSQVKGRVGGEGSGKNQAQLMSEEGPVPSSKAGTTHPSESGLLSLLRADLGDHSRSLVGLPDLRETNSSGQSSLSANEHSPMDARGGSRYSRELLSMFLEGSADDERSIGRALAQEVSAESSSLSPSLSEEYMIDATAVKKKRKSSRKKKHRGGGSPSIEPIREGVHWTETNKAIDTLLHASVPSVSNSDSTPRSHNTVGNVLRNRNSLSTSNRMSYQTFETCSSVQESEGSPPAMSGKIHGLMLDEREPPFQDQGSVGSEVSGLTSGFKANVIEIRHQVSVSSDITGGHFSEEADGPHPIEVKVERNSRYLKAVQRGESAATPAGHERTTKVVFGNVYVRDYERILSTNPSCTCGPPIGIGWRFTPEKGWPVDQYEEMRAGYRKCHSELLMPREVREDILRELGYSSLDLAKAVRLTIRSKNQRRQTVNNLGAARLEENLERAGRRVKNLFHVKKL